MFLMSMAVFLGGGGGNMAGMGSEAWSMVYLVSQRLPHERIAASSRWIERVSWTENGQG